jgi:hypothetical protein
MFPTPNAPPLHVDAHERPLPEGWIAEYDAQYDRLYFV